MGEATCYVCGKPGDQGGRLLPRGGVLLCQSCSLDAPIGRTARGFEAKRPSVPRRCSLCGSRGDEVVSLISGPRVFICEGCVEEGQRMIAVADEALGKPASHSPSGACGFCGKSAREVRHLVDGSETAICDACLDLCDEILAQRFAGGSQTVELTLRSGSASQRVGQTVDRVRAELASNHSCLLSILIDVDHERHAAELARLIKARLSDVARFWEPPVKSPSLVLAVVAFPRRVAG